MYLKDKILATFGISCIVLMVGMIGVSMTHEAGVRDAYTAPATRSAPAVREAEHTASMAESRKSEYAALMAKALEAAKIDVHDRNLSAHKRLQALNLIATKDSALFQTQNLGALRPSLEKQDEKDRAEEAARIAKLNAEAKRQAQIDAKRIAALKKSQGVRLGMSREDALASSWGKPERINTSTGRWGTHEQWVYSGHHNYLYFEDGVLTSISN